MFINVRRDARIAVGIPTTSENTSVDELFFTERTFSAFILFF